MSITKTQVVGTIQLPDGSFPDGGQVEFSLSNFDTVASADVTIIPHRVVADIDSSGSIDTLLWTNTEGARATRYMVTVVIPNERGGATEPLGMITVPSSGPVDLNDLLGVDVEPIASNVIMTPQEFGDTSVDSTDAINAMFAHCVPRNIAMSVSGPHNISGTIAPGGPYNCNWVNAQLIWVGDDVTVLTEVLENPSGDTYTGTGKHVLFDTSGCTGASNTGSLQIWGSAVGNMKQASVAAIPDNLVGMTAATATSTKMTWEQLYIRGCHYGWFHGDMSGSAATIQPYTRWSVTYLEIFLCKVGIEAGLAANTHDECVITNLHLTRNDDNGIIRTDFNGDSALLKGKRFPQDEETYTATTVVGDKTIEFDSAHGRSVGDIIAIEGASENLDGSKAIALVTRVASITDTDTLEVETAPLRAGSGLAIIVNPPSFRLENGKLLFDHVYFEEIHDRPVQIGNNAGVTLDSDKLSNGDFASRGGLGVVFLGITNMFCDITIHQVSGINNENFRYFVGIPAILSGSNAPAIRAEVSLKGYIPSQFVKSKPFGVYAPETDMLGSYTGVAGIPANQVTMLIAEYGNQTVYHQAGTLGDAQEAKYENGLDFPTPSSNLRGAEDLTGVTVSGADVSGPTGGVVTKTAGAEGYFWEDISVSAGDRLCIDVSATVTARGFTILLFNGTAGGTPAGNVTAEGPQMLQTLDRKVYIDVPANTDRIGMRLAAAAAGSVSKFKVRKLET